MRRSKTTIVLFTDWVDSTRTAVRLGDGADDLRRAHFALLRGALSATGGSEVKSLGDGIMAVFDSASAALECAESIQRAAQRRNRTAAEPMEIRIGISGGDVTVEDYDLFGIPVIEAARLCDAANGGEILLTRVVQALAGSAAGPRLEPLGTRDLKGLAPGLEVLRLAWTEAGGSSVAGLPPGVVRALSGPELVARRPELATLADAWQDAAGGRTRLVLLEGEPGAGKTRLAAEQARRSSDEGALALFGRCDPDVPTALRPWTAIVGQLVTAADPALVAAHVAEHGGELRRISPGVRARIEAAPPPPSGSADADRLRMFEAVTSLLGSMAARLPVVLVVDDLNWADRASLLLLRHILRVGELPLLVIATVRDAEADHGDAYRQIVADLTREPGSERVTVSGMDQEATLALLRQIVGEAETAPALAGAVRGETDGNALFTIELLRQLRDRGDLDSALATPDSWMSGSGTVRDVIDQRVSGLGPDVAPVLCAAAILGRTFTAAVLAEVLGADEPGVLDLLDRAASASVLVERRDDPGRYTFAHGLIQRVLADSVGAGRVQLLHRRAAEILERRAADDPTRTGEIAHHWLSAGEPDRQRALAAAVTAGERALDVLAPDEAVGWFTRALQLSRVSLKPDPRRTAELLLALGAAERQAGDEAFRGHLLEASAVAAREGFDDLLVEAALANSSGLNSSFLVRDDERISAIEAALRVVPADDLPARARLLATLASELWRERGRRLELADAALDAARGSRDVRVLIEVLYRRCLTTAEPDTVQERLALTEELLALTSALGEPLWELRAAAERMRVCMECGLAQEGLAMAERQGRLAPATGSAIATYMGMVAACWLLAREGRYAEAEQLAQDAAQLGAGVGPDVFAVFSAQLLAFRWDTGQLAELADLAVTTGTTPDALSSQRAIVPVALFEAGRLVEARDVLATGVRDGLPIDLDTLAAVTGVLWSEAAARLGDRDAAAALLPRIEPWQAQVAFAGVANFGSVARVCALLRGVVGDDDEAARHFERAETIDRAVGAVGPLARTLVDHGEWLVMRGDHRAATPRLAEARALASAHGLGGIAERVTAVGLLLEHPLS